MWHRMNGREQKKQFLQDLLSDQKRHNRARQLSVYELNRIKTTVRKLRLGIVPSGEDQKWLSKVNLLVAWSQVSHNMRFRLQWQFGWPKNIMAKCPNFYCSK